MSEEFYLEDEELAFDESAVRKIMTDNISAVISRSLYNQKHVQLWMSKIVDGTLQNLTSLTKPFKLSRSNPPRDHFLKKKENKINLLAVDML